MLLLLLLLLMLLEDAAVHATDRNDAAMPHDRLPADRHAAYAQRDRL